MIRATTIFSLENCEWSTNIDEKGISQIEGVMGAGILLSFDKLHASLDFICVGCEGMPEC